MLKKLHLFFLLAATVLTIAGDISAQTKRKPAVRKPVVKARPVPAASYTPAQGRRLTAFMTVWQTIKDNYFDQTFNGLNWEAIRKEYEAKTLAAPNDIQFHLVLQEMINRLSRSHFLIIPPEVYEEIEKAKVKARVNKKTDDKAEESNAEDEELDEDFLDDGEAKFGLGLDVRIINNQVVISSIDPASPAEKAGLKPGFVIDKINDVSLKELLQTLISSGAYGQKAEKQFPFEIVQYFLNGDDESPVVIDYQDEKDQPKKISVMRERLQGKLVNAVVNFPKQYFNFESRSLDNDTGYIKFNMFALPAVDGVCRALAEFKDKKNLIIDLRGNMGGSIGALIGITGLITDQPVILGTQIFKDHIEPVFVPPPGRKFGGKVIVLIDSLSFSAAEMFAGGLRESGRVKVVGERSAGEALPATMVQLATGARFMYPFANFKTPSGKSIEGTGVEPDVLVVRQRKTLLEGKDTQLDAALSLTRRDPAKDKILTVAGADPPPPAPKGPLGPIKSGLATGPVAGQPPPPVALSAPKPKPALEKKYDEEALNIIRAYVTAAGGEEALSKIATYSAKGTVSVNRGGTIIGGDVEVYRKGIGKSLEIIKVATAGEVRETFDGQKLFIQTEIMGNRESVIPDFIREMNLFTDLRELTRIKDIYQRVTYSGEYLRRGKTAKLVKAVTADGFEVAFAFDPDSKLLLQRMGRYIDIAYDDYRKVDGVLLPFMWVRSDVSVYKFNEIKLNPVIDDNNFVPKDNCFSIQTKLQEETKK